MKSDQVRTWFNPLLATLLFLAGLWLFKDEPVWLDEHTFLRFSWRYAYDHSWSLLKGIDYSLGAFHPPLHLEIHLLYSALLAKLGFFTPLAVRIFSLACSAMAFSITFQLLQAKYKIGWAALIYTYSNHIVMSYVWQIGPYAFVLFLASIYLVLLDQLLCDIEQNKNKSTRWFGLFLSAFVLSHYFAALLVAITGAILVWLTRGQKIQRWILCNYATAGLIIATWSLFSTTSELNPINYNNAIRTHYSTSIDDNISFFAGSLFNLDSNFIFLVALCYVVLIYKALRKDPLTVLSVSTVFLCLAFVMVKSLVSAPTLRPQLLIPFYPLLLFGVFSLPFQLFAKRSLSLGLVVVMLLLSFRGFWPVKFNLFFNMQDIYRVIMSDNKARGKLQNPLVRYHGISQNDFKPYGIVDQNPRLVVHFIQGNCPLEVDSSPGVEYLVFFDPCFKGSLPLNWHPIYERGKARVYRWENM